MGEFLGNLVSIVFGGLVLMVFVALVMSLPTMLLWNYVMVGTFGLPALGFLQALALNMLCGTLLTSSSTNSND